MAVERAYQYDTDYRYSNDRYRKESVAPERQDDRGRIKRSRERPQRNEAESVTNAQGLTAKELRGLLLVAVFIGAILIGLLVLNAYAASLQCQINKLTKENITLENEIDTLQMKVDSSTSIEQIESYAMDELKMTYPKAGQCIYISKDARLPDNFAAIIKEKTYQQDKK